MRYYYGFLAMLWTISVYAGQAPGLGGMADSLMVPVGVFSDFLYTACLVLGVSFLFAAVVKYFDHKRSPLFVPVSTVVFLFIAGLLFLIIPLASLVIKHGTSYSLFHR